MDKLKIMILTAKTGGGHSAVANALKQSLEKVYKNKVQVEVVDGLRTFAPFPISHIDKTYPWQIKLDGGVTYAASWRLLNNKGIARGFMKSWTPIIKNAVKKIIEKDVDVIISTHPVFVDPCVWGLKNGKKKTVFIAFVPDLKVTHALWCNKNTDLTLVPSQECYSQAIKHGVSKNKIQIVGLPIRLSFLEKFKNKQETRKSLSLQPNKSTILIMGGGDGMGKIEEIAKAIDNRCNNIQLIIITGRNQKVKRKLENISWKEDVTVLGFTNKVPEYLQASDLVVTKAGPTSVVEAMTTGTPIIINGFIPSQEDKNAKFVEETGSGIIEKKPEKIAEVVNKWISNKNLLGLMSKNALKNSDPDASLRSARAIYNFAKSMIK